MMADQPAPHYNNLRAVALAFARAHKAHRESISDHAHREHERLRKLREKQEADARLAEGAAQHARML
jgi:hypothetical protein